MKVLAQINPFNSFFKKQGEHPASSFQMSRLFLKFTRIYLNLLEFAWIYLNLLEFPILKKNASRTHRPTDGRTKPLIEMRGPETSGTPPGSEANAEEAPLFKEARVKALLRRRRSRRRMHLYLCASSPPRYCHQNWSYQSFFQREREGERESARQQENWKASFSLPEINTKTCANAMKVQV